MFRILALKFFFDFRVTLEPKSFQVIRDLDRPVVWGEHLDSQGNSPPADGEAARSIVQVLDPRGDGWRGVISVDDFRGATGGQFDPFRREIVERLLLAGIQPRFHNGDYRLFLDLLVTRCALAELFQEQKLFRFADLRKLQLRKFNCDKVYSRDPLLDGIVPMFEGASAGQDLACQDLGGS